MYELFELAAADGADGCEIELGVSSTIIQRCFGISISYSRYVLEPSPKKLPKGLCFELDL